MPYRAYGKCTKCGKGMTRAEAKASQWGADDRNELLCDPCFETALSEATELAMVEEIVASGHHKA